MKVILSLMAISMLIVPTGCSEYSKQEQALINEADTILNDLSKLLGQPLTRTVKKGFKDREELVEILDTMMQKEYPAEEFYADERMLKFFDLVPDDMNLEEKMKAFYMEQIGGFYNPEEKELYLIRAGQIPMLDNPIIQKTMMAHELTHALQDMKVDLESLLDEENSATSDVAMARLATTEGQASLVMLQYLLNVPTEQLPDLSLMRDMMGGSNEMMNSFTEFKNAPTYLKEKLALFPYMDGAVFYKNYIQQFPDRKPIDIYDHLPLSSEQILHFDKYLDKDYPQNLTLNNAERMMGADWKMLLDETFGEVDFRIYFQEIGNKLDSKVAAAGWDGTRFYLYENRKNNDLAMIMLTTWDSEKDVDEAAQNMKAVWEKKYPDASEFKAGYKLSIQNGKKVSVLIQKGLDLIILEEIPLESLVSLAKNVEDYKKVEIEK